MILDRFSEYLKRYSNPAGIGINPQADKNQMIEELEGIVRDAIPLEAELIKLRKLREGQSRA